MRTLTAAGLCLLCLPLAAQAQSEVTNQRLFDITPFLPEHYAQRVERFEQEPVVTGRVVFLGDSITESGKWTELLADSTVVNRGISGDVTFGVLDRLDDVIRRQPARLFVMIGINDVGKDIPDEVIADNHRKIIEQVQAGSPDTEIYVQSLLPVNPAYPGFPQHYDKENHVARVNKLLREVTAAAGCRFVNLFPLFLNAQERLDERYTYDGLHLNDVGYQVWIDYLRQTGYL